MNDVRNSRRLLIAIVVLAAVGTLFWLMFSRELRSPALGPDRPNGAPVASHGDEVTPGMLSPPGDDAGAPGDEPRTRLTAFAIDASGIHPGRSVIAMGRVKAPPASTATERLEFEVLDRAGRVVYAGSLDHPLRPRFEVAEEDGSGALRRVDGRVERNEFLLRMPAELEADRVRFFETVTVGSDGSVVRRPLGEASR